MDHWSRLRKMEGVTMAMTRSRDENHQHNLEIPGLVKFMTTCKRLICGLIARFCLIACQFALVH